MLNKIQFGLVVVFVALSFILLLDSSYQCQEETYFGVQR